MSPLFSWNFWFSFETTGLSATFEKGFFFLFALFVIMGALSRINARNNKDDRFLAKTFKYMAQLGIGMGLIGFVWLFLSFEQIYFFGARFWFLLWGIAVLLWGAWIVHFTKVEVPEFKKQGALKQETNKYLPRKR